MGEAGSDYFGKGNHKLHGPFCVLSPCGHCWDGFVSWVHLGKEERAKHPLVSARVTGWRSWLTPAGKGGRLSFKGWSLPDSRNLYGGDPLVQGGGQVWLF